MRGGEVMPKREEIKKDLLDQLERNGYYGEQYVDLVEAYMKLWDTFQKLTKDIEKNGVVRKYTNGENQWGYKKNDSVSERNKTVNQMLKILAELNLKPSPKDNNVPDEM
jgi:P27 family predicted phage terminase small subunit